MAPTKNDILQSIDHMISVPQVIIDSLRYIDQKILAYPPAFYNLNQLVEIINQDPVLVFTILSRSNSRFINSANEVTDLKVAINTMGPVKLRNLFYDQLGAHYSEYLKERAECLGVVQNRFSKQMTGCAKIAEKTVKYLINCNSSYSPQLTPFKYVIYYISLLQDIGMVVLDQYDHSLYQTLLNQANGNVAELQQMEITAFQGINHMELGALVLKKWRYPDIFVELTRNHHQLEDQGSDIYRLVKEIITYSNNIYYYRNCEISKENNPWYLTIIPQTEVIQGLKRFGARDQDENLFEVIDNFKYEKPNPPATQTSLPDRN